MEIRGQRSRTTGAVASIAGEAEDGLSGRVQRLQHYRKQVPPQLAYNRDVEGIRHKASATDRRSVA